MDKKVEAMTGLFIVSYEIGGGMPGAPLFKVNPGRTFLAGGEFPIPISQQNGAVTIEFKEFGIKLNFKPEVTSICGNKV